MAAVLHLVSARDPGLAHGVIERDLAAGDEVTVVLLPGARAPELPAGAARRRVPDDLAYADLLELLFAADRVASW